MHYSTTITQIGEMVAEFIRQEIILVFDDNAPPELLELALGHTAAPFEIDVEAGDSVVLGDKEYVVTAVGSEVNETLRKMGHCTMYFDSAERAELPGHLVLSGNGMPEVRIGDKFEIRYQR